MQVLPLCLCQSLLKVFCHSLFFSVPLSPFLPPSSVSLHLDNHGGFMLQDTGPFCCTFQVVLDLASNSQTGLSGQSFWPQLRHIFHCCICVRVKHKRALTRVFGRIPGELRLGVRTPSLQQQPQPHYAT